MDSPARASSPAAHVIPLRPKAPTPVTDDDLTIARQRMRHLASWKAKPIPQMHRAASTPADPATHRQAETIKRLALKVLALQMGEASREGGLR
jgi:hypothetical protein